MATVKKFSNLDTASGIDSTFLVVLEDASGNFKKSKFNDFASIIATSGQTLFSITDSAGLSSNKFGGDISVNGFDIVSTSNGNIEIKPNGTGKVGISTPAAGPKGLFHVYSGASGFGGTFNTSADDLIVENSGSVGMTFVCPASGTVSILFGDAVSLTAGVISYSHVTNKMTFESNDSSALTIDSVQNVNVRKILTVGPNHSHTADSITQYSMMVGDGAKARHPSQLAVSGGKFGTAAGSCQRTWTALRNVTDSTDSSVNLYIDPDTSSGPVTSGTKLSIPAETVAHFRVTVVASAKDATEISSSYVIEGLIENNGTTTSIVSQYAQSWNEDSTDYSVTVSADDTNDALNVAVFSSPSAGRVRWGAIVELTEIISSESDGEAY